MGMETVTIEQVRRLRGEVLAPGDKSISHRAALVAALSAGSCRLTNYLPGRDTRDTLRCLGLLGVRSTVMSGTGSWTAEVHGRGVSGFLESPRVLYAGTSASTARYIPGLIAADPIASVFDGAPSLRRRPMDRILEPLAKMGVNVLGRASDTRVPFAIRGGPLQGLHHRLEVASAGVKTTLMLAALRAQGISQISSPRRTRDHTELLLEFLRAPITRPSDTEVCISPLDRPLDAFEFEIPGEISVAIYWLAVASVHPDAEISVRNVSINETRTAVLDVLSRMGANIRLQNQRMSGGEAIGDIVVRSAVLHGTDVTPDEVPLMIDEFPGFALAASLAEGTTTVRGAAELRLKKTNRIEDTALEFNKLGAAITPTEDGMIIQGVGRLKGAAVGSHGDHRLGTALSVAGLVAHGQTTVRNVRPIAATSYPLFWRDLEVISRG